MSGRLKNAKVPAIALLRSGTPVNIVLKADQSTGRLTTGRIATILTRGDHPRGVKVRLSDGQVGRVQSLAEEGHTTEESNTGRGHGSGSLSGWIQEDYRYDAANPPIRDHTLLDFVKAKPSSQKGRRQGQTKVIEQNDEIGTQELLQLEFPKIDAALIAAILADQTSFEEVREVLRSLS